MKLNYANVMSMQNLCSHNIIVSYIQEQALANTPRGLSVCILLAEVSGRYTAKSLELY